MVGLKPRILSLLPEERQALTRLWLNATDAARVCGVTVRQLTYWTDKGIIPSSSHSGRSYDVAALARVIAIDRAMAEGLTLEKAARLLEERAGAAATDEQPVGAVIDALVASIEGYRRRLPAYLALANVRRAAAELAAVEVDALLGSDPNADNRAQQVAARLNAVVDVVEKAVADLTAPLDVPEAAGEMAGVGSAV